MLKQLGQARIVLPHFAHLMTHGVTCAIFSAAPGLAISAKSHVSSAFSLKVARGARWQMHIPLSSQLLPHKTSAGPVPKCDQTLLPRTSHAEGGHAELG